ncbi:hypothetical protein PMAYCL1PPCAC_03882, partial [Pristionchus mayeri]
SCNGPIFIQVSIICTCNVLSSLLYLSMNFFYTSPTLNMLAHISWQLAHGVPPFIYLILNKTVQRHMKMLLGLGGTKANAVQKIATSSSSRH